MAVDAHPKRDIPEVCYPDNNFGTAVTPGNSWAWSAWAQLTASLADHLVLSAAQLYVLLSTTATPVLQQFQVEIGTGAAGSEVTVARSGSAIGYSASGSAETKSIFRTETLWLPPVRIAAGTRVAVRATKQGTDPLALNVTLIGFPAADFPPVSTHPHPDPYLRASEPAAAVTYPNAGLASVTTAGTIWVYGSWVELIAAGALSRHMLAAGFACGDAVISGAFHLQLGTGSAGNEVPHALAVAAGRSSNPGPGFGQAHFVRPALIKPGERVAARVRGRPVSTAFAVQLLALELA